ncbi:MAG: DUF4157 domain-containing protein [Deltaproteobacteria bacterium]|nr:DUF4157 domain-containing protein [Deltaproteobacteria bacterium]
MVQRRAEGTARLTDPGAVDRAARGGVGGGGGALPFRDRIQASFGRHDVAGVRAHTDGAAGAASRAIGARAFARGSDVAFAGAPDLFTAAHEAAHVVQQRRGIDVPGGVGAAGDRHERHADAVARAVVEGKSAEGLLDGVGGSGASARGAVQRSEDPAAAASPAAPSSLPTVGPSINEAVLGHLATQAAEILRPVGGYLMAGSSYLIEKGDQIDSLRAFDSGLGLTASALATGAVLAEGAVFGLDLGGHFLSGSHAERLGMTADGATAVTNVAIDALAVGALLSVHAGLAVQDAAVERAADAARVSGDPTLMRAAADARQRLDADRATAAPLLERAIARGPERVQRELAEAEGRAAEVLAVGHELSAMAEMAGGIAAYKGGTLVGSQTLADAGKEQALGATPVPTGQSALVDQLRKAMEAFQQEPVFWTAYAYVQVLAIVIGPEELAAAGIAAKGGTTAARGVGTVADTAGDALKAKTRLANESPTQTFTRPEIVEAEHLAKRQAEAPAPSAAGTSAASEPPATAPSAAPSKATLDADEEPTELFPLTQLESLGVPETPGMSGRGDVAPKDAAPGTAMSPYSAGMTMFNAKAIRELAQSELVEFIFRRTNVDAVDHAVARTAGFKPADLKSKTVNQDDLELTAVLRELEPAKRVGWSQSDAGLAAIWDRSWAPPSSWVSKIDARLNNKEMQLSDATKARLEKAKARLAEREAELKYLAEGGDYDRLEKNGKIRIEGGIIKNGENRLDDTIPEGMPFAGDYDLFDIIDAITGKPVPLERIDDLVTKLKAHGVRHGAVTRWEIEHELGREVHFDPEAYQKQLAKHQSGDLVRFGKSGIVATKYVPGPDGTGSYPSGYATEGRWGYEHPQGTTPAP